MTSIGRLLRALRLIVLDLLARVQSWVLPIFVREPCRVRYFPLWEQHGFYLRSVHFYEPIPDRRTRTEALWEKESALVGIDMREADQCDFLHQVLPTFRSEYVGIPHEPTVDSTQFYLNNGYFTGADALVYYGVIRHFQPQLIIEVGAGFSSRLAAQACRRNGHGELVCIEPNPDPILRAGFPGLTTLIAKRVEEVETDLFQNLRTNDILFIDSSHVVRCGGDVNCLLLEIVPRLNPGVIIHLHDIFLPQEYHKAWVMERYWFFSEQYLLHAFLTSNAEFQVLFANRFMSRRHQRDMEALFPPSSDLGNSSFWMRRRLELARGESRDQPPSRGAP